jgi:hypothetical protein
MGSYSELYFSNTRANPGRGGLSNDSPYLLSKYHLPILWLGLFDTPDIDDDAHSQEPTDVWPYLVKQTKEAAVLFGSRWPFLSKHFPALESQWHDQLLSMLRDSRFEYVHLDTHQIGSMVVTGPEWRRELEVMLEMFSSETSPAQGLLSRLLRKPSPRSPALMLYNMRFGARYDGDRRSEPWAYCGASGTDEAMPWESGL